MTDETAVLAVLAKLEEFREDLDDLELQLRRLLRAKPPHQLDPDGPFSLAAITIPEGAAYSWIAIEINGRPVSDERFQFLEDQGWRFVPPERHPELPCGTTYRGMALFERSKVLDDEATRSLYLKAKQQEQNAAQLAGAFLADNLPAGFTAVADPPDLPFTALSSGWASTEAVKSARRERELILAQAETTEADLHRLAEIARFLGDDNG